MTNIGDMELVSFYIFGYKCVDAVMCMEKPFILAVCMILYVWHNKVTIQIGFVDSQIHFFVSFFLLLVSFLNLARVSEGLQSII